MENTRKEVRTQCVKWTRHQIFEILQNMDETTGKQQIVTLATKLLDKPADSFSIDEPSVRSLKKVIQTIKSKWQKACRIKERFLEQNKAWLDDVSTVTIIFPEKKSNRSESEDDSDDSRSSLGRPETSFAESSDRSKRRKTEDLRKNYSTDELTFAAKMNLRSEGAKEVAKVVNDVVKSPDVAKQYIDALESFKKPRPKALSPDAALSLVIDSKLSKTQYQNIRVASLSCDSNVFPSYHTVLSAKKLCYPNGVSVSETSAKVPLQSLLNHTASRILKMQKEVIDCLDRTVSKNLTLYVKWGFDGSSSQKDYKQGFEDESSSDSNVILTSLVPLELSGVDEKTKSKIIVWKNPRPSSPRFCRPIHLLFLAENKKSTIEEKRVIDDQITSLEKLETCLNAIDIQVNFHLSFTMIDGKVCNVVTDTASAMRCYLCSATSKDFNEIHAMKERPVNTSNLQYGLSTLHCWIRMFECLLHLGYKMNNQKWQIRGENEKKIRNERKAIIQQAFKKDLHLIVDRPKQIMGNSNDGNTARRFFENSEDSARILGIDHEIVHRFHIILQVLASGFNVKIEKFEKYCFETAELMVSLYPWYKMSTTVHKVLIHGSTIVASTILPIGQMSEEAQESRNKDVRNFRENFSRKCSRTKTMEDVFYRLLASSDPLISSLRKLPPKKGKNLLPEAIDMLMYEKSDDGTDSGVFDVNCDRSDSHDISGSDTMSESD